MMKDLDSFVLDAVYLRESTNKYSQRHNNDASGFCYFFRSHNSMGGYGNTGEALLNERGQIEILVDNEPTDRSGVYYGMMTCTPQRRLADITAEVTTALNPPAPPSPTLRPILVSPSVAGPRAPMPACARRYLRGGMGVMTPYKLAGTPRHPVSDLGLVPCAVPNRSSGILRCRATKALSLCPHCEELSATSTTNSKHF